MRNRRRAIAGSAALAFLLAGCGSSAGPAGSSSTPSSAPSAAASSAAQSAQLKSASTSLGTVVTNASGLTLYWFAKDTSTTSACSGACAAAWPPVAGTPQAVSGATLPGKLGTITRSGGAAQATYNGHPLYTFAGDSSPGQVNGNGVNGYGGLWYAVKTTSAAGSSPTPSSSSGGGYG